MKSALDQLTYKEKQLLNTFYGTEQYKALRKLIDIERLELAKDHVDERDILQIRFLSGQVQGLKRLVGGLKTLHTQSVKNEELKKKS
jgi:hypothetical protein